MIRRLTACSAWTPSPAPATARTSNYWNRYVAVTQMGGHGTFTDERTGVDVTNGSDDLVSAKAPALEAYQLSLAAPPPPEGSFDEEAAARGKAIFEGAGQCATCHSGSTFTDANSRLRDPSEVVSEPEPNDAPSYASRSATRSTAPHRSAVSGNTRPTSTTGSPRRSKTWSSSTTTAVRSISQVRARRSRPVPEVAVSYGSGSGSAHGPPVPARRAR